MFRKSIISLIALLFIILISSQSVEANNTEKLRYRAEFLFANTKEGFQITVRTNVINFDTGESTKEEFVFNDKSLAPKVKMEDKKIDGKLFNTPYGLKAYADFYDAKTSTLYEFDFNSQKLRKVTETKDTIFLEPSLGIYSIRFKANGNSNEASQPLRYYRISDNKYLFDGFYLRRIHNMLKACSICTQGDYYIERGDKPFKVGYNGTLTPIKITDWEVPRIKQGEKYGTATIKFSKGSFILKHTSKDYKVSSLVWVKNGKEKVLIPESKGYINTYNNFTVSPNKKYLVVQKEVLGDKRRTEQQMYYIFDIENDMKLVRKLSAHYRLSSAIEWYTDDLMKIVYYSSLPDRTPPYYYSISKNVSTKSTHDTDGLFVVHSTKDYRYWDDFSYIGLTSLNDPKPKKK
ncbi:hypothetical protein [Paenibacillus sp. GCM10028914]|uniref:hypothetical protein n=1 Tax=Paenibacillus sp. GCM10028914 TaxID=3273416 RepID=UPI00360872C4